MSALGPARQRHPDVSETLQGPYLTHIISASNASAYLFSRISCPRRHFSKQHDDGIFRLSIHDIVRHYLTPVDFGCRVLYSAGVDNCNSLGFFHSYPTRHRLAVSSQIESISSLDAYTRRLSLPDCGACILPVISSYAPFSLDLAH